MKAKAVFFWKAFTGNPEDYTQVNIDILSLEILQFQLDF